MISKEEKRKLRNKRNMEKRLRRIQNHHITYKPERIVTIFQGEHFVLTQMQRRKYVSVGFIEAAEYELARMKKGKLYKLYKKKGRK